MHDPGDRDQHAEVRESFDLASARTRERGVAEERRIGMELLEEVDDRQGLEEEVAAFGLEHGQLAEWIAGEMLGSSLLSVDQPDRDLLDLDSGAPGSLLGEIEPDLRGIGRDGKRIELHRRPLVLIS